jgi:hypothetical protein
LKTAAGRHGPKTLSELLEKIAVLREWRGHEWHFSEALSLEHQQRYAQAFDARPPSIAKRQLETSQVEASIDVAATRGVAGERPRCVNADYCDRSKCAVRLPALFAA